MKVKYICDNPNCIAFNGKPEHKMFYVMRCTKHQDGLFADGSTSESFIDPVIIRESKKVYCADCGKRAKEHK